MADISMCKKDHCPKAHQCYRYIAVPDPYWQSYIDPEYTDEGCEDYWPAEEKDDTKE